MPLLVCALSLAQACATTRAEKVGSARAVARPGALHDSLDLHFRALTEGLQGEGLARGSLFERGFLPPSGRVAYPVHIAANECALFVALASASMADLDASLFTAEGSALIEDDSTSSRPTLTFCASASEPIDAYLTLHAYQGAGSFVAAQFTRALRDGDDLRTAFAGRSISALGQLAQTLHERGFEDAAPRVNLPLGDARPVRMALNVTAGECYTLAAEGGDGLSELGLRLVDGEGGELAHGLGDPTPGEPQLAALQYCASERAELALEVVARRGQGIARIGRFRATQAVVGGARALWLGEPTPSREAWTAAKTSGVAGTAGAKAAPGRPPFATKQVALQQGQVIELPMTARARAEAGTESRAPPRCERWQAELRPGLSRATLRIEGERGELLAEVDSQHMQACAVVCDARGAHRISLVGRAGFGTIELSGTLVDPVEPQVAVPFTSACSACTDASRCSMSSGLR